MSQQLVLGKSAAAGALAVGRDGFHAMTSFQDSLAQTGVSSWQHSDHFPAQLCMAYSRFHCV